MFLVDFSRIIRSGLRSFVRNGWLTVAAIGMMVITLMIISFFAILSLLIAQGSDIVKKKADMSIYFKANATNEQVIQFEDALKNDSSVYKISFTSSEKAVADYREMYKLRPKLLDALENSGSNSLPSSVQVEFYDPEKQGNIASIINEFKTKNIVDRPSYEGQKKAVVDKIVKVAGVTKKAGWALASVFAAISLIIIFNTVRLAIFARREEIEIMQLVGATNWFIRGPFVFEGAIYGFIGTIVSVAIMYPLFAVFSPSISQFFGIANIFNFLKLNLWSVLMAEFLLGTLIGILSSFFAIRKYLRLA
ncbi:MAG: Cell division protein [candidate division CPR2 bacterium GW2011_GWC1_39_9]|uniref:Cell division protein FtsX n=1 Tax=candidate division CPR2 bacterium GW2011_GWC2_39_10 TaxID=1618345 RepID=A0A0G0Q0P7_UNCC2|nr:MAG: Cell division protein [candidate division CPR2 bacterium GW2011_GWC2_39_10]KKR34949.1 MAG: Cell division protein [candidate division CPR2 bacterium GW2011_GWC1_39_9]